MADDVNAAVYKEIGALRNEFTNQITGLRSETNVRFDKLEQALDVRLNQHKLEHQQDDWRRSSRIRWAVTTVLSGIGVAAAIIVPLIVR